MPVLTAQEIAGLRNGTKAIYVYGEIRYWDIFGKKERFTKYRLLHNWESGPIGESTVLSASDEGNEAT